jgi:predicted enzyme related to lactoylglutathione lyase
MIQVTDIAFSCYAVTDVARARAFYEGVLGLKPTYSVGEAGGMQWVEYDIGAGTLSIGSAPGWNPSSEGCCVALEVEDFDAAIAQLKQHQVRFKMEAFPTPVCRMAFIFDPDGNVICIHKRNPGHP